MRNSIWSFILIVGLTAACENDEVIPFVTLNPVNLSSLQDGQRSYFLRYSGDCGQLNTKFAADTLVLQVHKKNDSLFLMEYFTPRSASFIVEGFKDTIAYHVSETNNTLLIKNRSSSRLFYFYGNDSLRLSPVSKVAMNQENCRVLMNNQPFVGDEIGSINRFSIVNRTVKEKIVVSCVPIFFQLEGYLIYDQNEFQVSQTIIGEKVNGWMKL